MTKVHKIDTNSTLRQIRDRHNLTVQEMANLTDCTHRTMSRYLAGDLVCPECRVRLLRFEVGDARPSYTPVQRRAKTHKQHFG